MTPKVFGYLVFIGGIIFAVLCAVFIPWNGPRIGFTIIFLIVSACGFYIARKNLALWFLRP